MRTPSSVKTGVRRVKWWMEGRSGDACSNLRAGAGAFDAEHSGYASPLRLDGLFTIYSVDSPSTERLLRRRWRADMEGSVWRFEKCTSLPRSMHFIISSGSVDGDYACISVKMTLVL